MLMWTTDDLHGYNGRREAALNILSDEERQIITLHSISGLKHREIADLLNLKLTTVLSKYHRGLKKLKDAIREV